MAHEEYVQKVCRICQIKLEKGKTYDLLTTTWLCDFLDNHYMETLIHNEDRNRYSHNICIVCYLKLYNSKAKEDRFLKDQKKKPKDKRKDFVLAKNITVATDEDWEHNENCKICQTFTHEHQQVEEPQHQVSPELPSPGVVQKKETFLTPQAKKAQRKQSGSGQPRQLFKKTLDDDDEMEVEKSIHIASDNEIIKKENIKDENIFEVFKCVICERIPRDPLLLDMCGHYCCRVCLNNFKKISKKCPKCQKKIAIDTILRLPKEVKHIFKNITVKCHKCRNEMNM